MKRLYSLLLSIILSLTYAATARDFTYTYEGQTLTYTVIDEDAKTCATKAGDYSQGGNSVKGALILPETAIDENGDKFTLVSISKYSFSYSDSLISVTIPDRVTYINFTSFFDCPLFSEVHVSSIDDWCKMQKVDYEWEGRIIKWSLYVKNQLVENLVIPESVSEIKDNAFSMCSSIKTVQIPEGLTSIGASAFCGCEALTKVNIPQSVKSFGEYIFARNPSLTSVTIEEGITEIPFAIFLEDSALTSIKLPESITFIDGAAFSNCVSLTSINIPERVTEISTSFQGCTSLREITIPAGVTTIYGYSFQRCTSLSEITLPEGVTSIGDNAFQGCASLTRVNLPTSLESIGRNAFSGISTSPIVQIQAANPPEISTSYLPFDYNTIIYVPDESINAYKLTNGWRNNQFLPLWCEIRLIENESSEAKGLKLVRGIGSIPSQCTIPSSMIYTNGSYLKITEIADSLFLNNKELVSITIPSLITRIGSKAFDGCDNLKSIRSLSGIPPTLGKEVFSKYEGVNLYVPLKKPYEDTEYWNKFTISEISSSALRYEVVFDTAIGKNVARVVGTEANISNGVKIPSEVTIDNQVYPVTSIADSAFMNNPDIITVEIPNSVSSIGTYAFAKNKALTTVYLPHSPCSIGEYAFAENESLYISRGDSITDIGKGAFSKCLFTNITIPGIITSLPEDVLYECVNLQRVTLPATLTSIESGAFYGCKDLTSITLPESIETIGKQAFYGCSSLPSLKNLPSSLISIGEQAFYGCTTIEEVFLPNRVETLGAQAFNGCTFFRTLKFPSTLKEIGSECFNKAIIYNLRCSALTPPALGEDCFKEIIPGSGFEINLVVPAEAVEIYSQTEPWSSFKISAMESDALEYTMTTDETSGKTVAQVIGVKPNIAPDCVIPSEVTIDEETYRVVSIQSRAFSNNTDIESVIIPESVTSIGESAFTGCTNLTTVTIPESVTSIGSNAFEACSSLTSVIIPQAITEIGSSTFNGCSALTSIKIPSSVISIGNYAFRDCKSLTSVTIPNSVTTIGSNAFSGCKSLQEITIPQSVISIGNYAFYNCSSLTSATIENGVTSIGSNAFADCSSLPTIKIPDSVTEIGGGAFSGCSFTSITIPDAVTTIGANTFYNCSSLTTVTLPKGLTTIGTYAFQGCESLTSIALPDELKTLGSGAFRNCSSLTSITIPGKVTSIESGTFYGCSALTSITMSDDVTSIGSMAFDFCSKLTEFTIPKSLDSIATYAFSGCKGIKTVYVDNIEHWINISFENEMSNPIYYGAELVIGGKSATVIEVPEETQEVKDFAFAGLKSIIEVIIPDAVEKIGNGSFTGCSSIENINIPETVKTIGEKAFKACTGLTSAILGKIFTPSRSARAATSQESAMVGSFAFDSCTNLMNVAIGSNITMIADSAFRDCGKIERIDSYGLRAPEVSSNAFEATTKTMAILHVPTGYKDIYETSAVWNEFTTILDDLAIDPALGVNLNLSDATLTEGTTLQLIATMNAGTESTDFEWSSSSPEVASVTETGLVEALKTGKTTITVIAPTGARATCEVTVVATIVDAAGLTLNIEEAEVEEGSSLQLTAIVLPDDTTDKNIAWTSSDETVATVNASGLVAALKAGTATITASTANGLTATCTVTVTAKPSGIENVDGDGVPAVRVESGEIVISGDAVAEVFSLTGSRVAVANGGRVSGLPRGIYLVRTGGKTFKIVL